MIPACHYEINIVIFDPYFIKLGHFSVIQCEEQILVLGGGECSEANHSVPSEQLWLDSLDYGGSLDRIARSSPALKTFKNDKMFLKCCL